MIRKDLTLYELCGEDFFIFAKLNPDNEVTVMVENYDEEVVYNEKSNIAAWESLVAFSKMVLRQNEKILKELEEND